MLFHDSVNGIFHLNPLQSKPPSGCLLSVYVSLIVPSLLPPDSFVSSIETDHKAILLEFHFKPFRGA